MNIVFSVRVIASSFITIFLILIPRMLIFYGLKSDILSNIVSPWSTFVLFALAGGILVWPWLKNRKFMIPLIVLVIAGASALTFYLCDLPLPW